MGIEEGEGLGIVLGGMIGDWGGGEDWRLGRIGFREGGLASSVTLIRVTKGRGLHGC